MGRGRRRAAAYSPSSSSSYSMESSSNHYHCTDLRLGLGFDETSEINEADLQTSTRTREQYLEQAAAHNYDQDEEENENEESGSCCYSLFVKVYMEGIPIGRKLNLLANNGYHDLISTLQLMFNFNNSSHVILWSGSGFGLDIHRDGHYDFVLTYQDKEGDWMMVGDVPWEMFLSTVKRLKIIRPYQYS